MAIESQHCIESKQDVMVGKPCIKGIRLTVEAILEMLTYGMNHVEIISYYPRLGETKMRAVLIYVVHVNKIHIK